MLPVIEGVRRRSSERRLEGSILSRMFGGGEDRRKRWGEERGRKSTVAGSMEGVWKGWVGGGGGGRE